MIGQQPNLARRAVQLSGRQVRLAQGSAGHRQGVDGIGLAIGPGTGTGVSHHLRRNPNNPFTRTQQVPLQTPRKMPAVFDGPDSLGPELFSPAQQTQVVLARGAGRAFTHRPAYLINRDRGVVAVVRIDSQNDHGPISLPIG